MKISDEDVKRCSKPLLHVIKQADRPQHAALICAAAAPLIPEVSTGLLTAVLWELVNQDKLQIFSNGIGLPAKPQKIRPVKIPKPPKPVKVKAEKPAKIPKPDKPTLMSLVTSLATTSNERRIPTMAKKLSPEEVVIDFYQNGDLNKVETVVNIAKGILKRRFAEVKKPALVKTRAAKTTATTVVAPAVQAAEVAAA